MEQTGNSGVLPGERAGGGKLEGSIERESPSVCLSTGGGVGSTLSLALGAISVSAGVALDCAVGSSFAGPSWGCTFAVSSSVSLIGTEPLGGWTVFSVDVWLSPLAGEESAMVAAIRGSKSAKLGCQVEAGTP